MSTVAFAPLIAGVALLIAGAVVLLQRRHQAGLVGRTLEPLLPDDDATDILYFTGVACTICHVAQRPALARLVATRRDISVREVDVADEPELAQRYRVLTLPTTVVLDHHRRVVAVNAGFANESQLSRQVDQARRHAEPLTVA